MQGETRSANKSRFIQKTTGSRLPQKTYLLQEVVASRDCGCHVQMRMQDEERESALGKLTERYKCFTERYKCVVANLRQGTFMLTKSFQESRRHWRKLELTKQKGARTCSNQANSREESENANFPEKLDKPKV